MTTASPRPGNIGWGASQPRQSGLRTAGQQAAFLLPYLKPGMRLLDCGCGPGTITLGLAEAVAPGEVVGIDIGAQQIELARANAAQRDTTNVRFQVADVLKLPFEDNSFDVVYANTLLMYFPDKAPPLKEMHRVLRPGGLIGVRDVDGGGDVTWPADGAMREAGAIVLKLFERSGRVTPFAGRGSRSYLHSAGFARCEGSANLEVFGTPESLEEVAAQWVTRVRNFDVPVELGWVDRPTLERLAKEIQEWATSPGAFHSRLYCSAIGWKEG